MARAPRCCGGANILDSEHRAWGPSPLLCLYGLRARIVARSTCPFALPNAIETTKYIKVKVFMFIKTERGVKIIRDI